MCAHPAYRVTVRRLLPQLRTLDDEHNALAEAAAKAAAQLGDSDPLALVMAAVEPKPWFSESDLDPTTLLGDGDGAAAIEGGSEFQQALTDSKRMSVRAQSLLADFKAARKPPP